MTTPDREGVSPPTVSTGDKTIPDQYAYCGKCRELIHYVVYEGDDGESETTFPRGEFLAHQDYLVTGIAETREEAEAWVATYDFATDPYRILPGSRHEPPSA